MKKLLSLLLAAVLCLAMFAGCAPKETTDPDTTDPGTTDPGAADPGTQEPDGEAAPKTTFRIASLKGPTTMGLVKLMDDSDKGQARHDYQVTMHGTADEIVPLLAKGEIDVAFVPCNLAAVLYQKTEKGIQIAGINSLGVLYTVDTGDEVHSVADLKGKTIYTVGKGTTPEFSLNYILSQNGLEPGKDVTVEFKSEATEVAAMIAQGQQVIAMLPQPFVATAMAKNENLRIALDMTEEWDKVVTDGSSLITGVIVARREFIEQNGAAFDEFLEDYAASVSFVNGDVDAGAALVGGYDIVPEAIAKTALPLCNIVSITGSEMKDKVSGYLNVLYEQNAESVGGTLPDDGFYYVK
ncbi:ABC transporter substrate-binding protein [Feifania hominis]|uniref:ABC transporter substrate-binding protein n=1 Tax=Feifania hominis TaxID=2763660 RepID=A0A926HVH7_9FIRM|nr:PhnD/SsuA/transferrin family substrate-binding protein [Feifania hominis]MBC8536631.1 ABC transporter substrate-binding protein [Feifania hominis]